MIVKTLIKPLVFCSNHTVYTRHMSDEEIANCFSQLHINTNETNPPSLRKPTDYSICHNQHELSNSDSKIADTGLTNNHNLLKSLPGKSDSKESHQASRNTQTQLDLAA